jgi:AraC family transcriptional regulator, regulatory protein of adaptative response / DNA-3-methyladenine glycosylase II
MSGFSGVVTTGIYCRPGCGARPHQRNVRPFSNAAAAEAAGYRACLRCRPYRSAPPLSWSGPELVCRAVQLVLDGGLDDGLTEHDLAARLGISARHLRRLFAEHVGATPDQLARSRRAHFARRLLDDTDLTVMQVAFASGFGSVRQLNRASHEVFRASPRELRAHRRKADRLAADGGLTLRLPYQPPLDWKVMLGYFRTRAIAGVEHVSQDTYRRTVAIDGDPGVIELRCDTEEQLLLRAHLPHWEGLIHHVDRARRVFNLDADMPAVVERLAGDPLVGPLIKARPGLRPPGAWDPFEIGVRAIVGQHVSVAAANGIIARLVARTGTVVPGLEQLGLTHLFPAPADLAHADLDGLGLTTARARAVGAFARAVLDGQIAFDKSRTLQQLVDSLTATAGLGPWTAHYVALRLGAPDAFPAADAGLHRALQRATGHSVSTREVEALSQRWRPHRAHVAAQLWLADA